MSEATTATPTSHDVRTFHDLRAFAADAPAATGPGDAGKTLPLADGPVTVHALALNGQGRVETMPVDTFVIVLDGALSIDGAPQRSVVLPAGSAFDWQAGAGTRVVTMTCAGGPAGADRPVAIDEGAELASSNPPLAALLVGPTPSCRNFTDYRSGNGEFVCGTWDSTPYHRTTMRYGHHELMHLLAGSVTFEDEAGRRGTFRTDDIFLVERGASCSWLSEEDVKKVYAIYRPAA